MGAFLEQYGIAIFVLVIIGIMVLMATGIGKEIEELLAARITQFAEKAKDEMAESMSSKNSFSTGTAELN